MQQHPGGRTRFGRGRRRLRLPNGKAAGIAQAACLETNTKPKLNQYLNAMKSKKQLISLIIQAAIAVLTALSGVFAGCKMA